MLEEAISVLSFWASMSSWLTSALLFLLLNLMIFTIAFTSGFATHKPPPHHHPDTDLRQHPHLETQLTRAPSILQRFKSLNFYNYIPSPQLPTAEIHHNDAPPPPTVAPAPETETHVAEEVVIEKEEEEQDEGPTMDEIYTRIIQSKGNNSAHYGRQNSDTKPSGGQIPVSLPRKIKKSASEKSAFNHFGPVERENAAVVAVVEEEEEEEEVEVDARADDFISKFRRQLNMQRLDSIQRYKETTSKVEIKRSLS
ncbi:hypothetical protein Cgig2_016315 [Carnegiea gigantea]|uniref:DUF4408 domain-containing protein n=1 Tax=Carnegiea gigantea TaxID=171969 RepID=A0A9Q1KG17_9CARY|nr:hypothetical protein Cgig2_016315 [Carnegiea gigantea]